MSNALARMAGPKAKDVWQLAVEEKQKQEHAKKDCKTPLS
jgi:hypothetical protein